MRAPFRFTLVPCGLLVLFAFVANLSAQQPIGQQPAGKSSTRPTQPQTAPPKGAPATKDDVAKPPRPAAMATMVVPAISPELQQILDDWERHSSQIKSLHGKHTRFVYNEVFEIEKRSEGKWYLETPDKGRIDLVGKPPNKNEVSKRIGKYSGKPYRIESDRAEMWICSGEEIVIVNGDEKTYEVAPVPAHLRGTNIVNGPLPFLFGMKATDAQKRYALTLLSNGKTSVRIEIVPLLPRDKENYQRAELILDKSRYLPIAVKLQDPSGNLETVYSFEILDVNDSSLKAKLVNIFGDRDPFHPNLKQQGYKLVVSAQEEIANPRLNGKDGKPIKVQQATRPGTSSIGPSRK